MNISNITVPEGSDGINEFNSLLIYLRDSLGRAEISSYSISPIVKTMPQFHRNSFREVLNIAIDGKEPIGIDFHLLGTVYTLGTLDDYEGIKRSINDFVSEIVNVVQEEDVELFNIEQRIFYDLYLSLVGD